MIVRWGAFAVVAIVAVALLVPSFTFPATEMDEGALLLYPALVQDGEVPHRDFETFYGPGDPWLLAGVYWMAGDNLTVERAVGVAYRLTIVAGAILLALEWGLLIAAGSGLLVAGAIAAVGDPAAYAVLASIGFVALALGLVIRASHWGKGRWRPIAFICAGALAGFAVVMRFDFVLLLAAFPPALARVPGSDRRRFAAGVALGLLPYVPHLLIVGAGKIAKIASDLRVSEPARSLAVPSPADPAGRILLVQLVAIGLFLALGSVLAWSAGRRREGLAVLSIGLLCAGLLPLEFSRIDQGAILRTAALPLGLLPVLGAVALSGVRRLPRVLVRVTAVVAAALVFLALGPIRSGASWQLKQVFGARGPGSFTVEVGDRIFRLGDERAAANAGRIATEARDIARADASLIVAPGDLRRTNYTDTFLYYLLPELHPGTYYVEMNPRAATRAESGFREELERADYLILNSRWDVATEPNGSRQFGSSAPNRLVRQLFCLRTRAGTYRLYERCAK